MRRIHRCGTLSARDEVVARLIHDQALAFHANGAEEFVLQLADPVLGPVHTALLLHELLLHSRLLHLDLICTCSAPRTMAPRMDVDASSSLSWSTPPLLRLLLLVAVVEPASMGATISSWSVSILTTRTLLAAASFNLPISSTKESTRTNLAFSLNTRNALLF